jgi:hypothetical protein
MVIAAWIAIGLFIASLPYWIPNAVIALRMSILTRVNGEEGLGIPGDIVDVSLFKQVYSHPAANGRSRGAALSDLFWYWLSPGPEMHQEHLEPGERDTKKSRGPRGTYSPCRRARRKSSLQAAQRE